MKNLTSLLNRASVGTKSAKIMDQHWDLLVFHLARLNYGVGGLKHLRMGHKSDIQTWLKIPTSRPTPKCNKHGTCILCLTKSKYPASYPPFP